MEMINEEAKVPGRGWKRGYMLDNSFLSLESLSLLEARSLSISKEEEEPIPT